MAASLTLSDRAIEAVPGGSAMLIVSVLNTGPTVDEVAVTIDGEAAAWAIVDPSAIVLFPGAAGDVAVTFRVPEGPRVQPGPAPFEIRAIGSGDPTAAWVEGVVEVAPYAEAVLTLSPAVWQGTRRASGSVVIENHGNDGVELRLSGTSEGASVTVEPSRVKVGPGEMVSAIVSVAPDRSYLRGPTRRIDFVITAEGSEHPTVVVHGAMTQQARFGQSSSALLAGLVLAALLFPLGWFGAVRPLIRQETERQVTRLNGSGAANGRPGPGGVVVAGGTPIDGRLFLDASGQTAYTVPAGRTLRVTDIVLQNPGANSGLLRVRRGDQILLEVRLENFRTQDFHWVSPITFAGEQKLVLEAQCGGTGTNECSPSAFFSAFLV